MVRFLRSRWSRPLIGWYARRHGIPLTREERRRFSTFRDFFAREREEMDFDPAPRHLISPCDGWLSHHSIQADSSFHIKGFSYRLEDLLQDRELSARYHGETASPSAEPPGLPSLLLHRRRLSGGKPLHPRRPPQRPGGGLRRLPRLHPQPQDVDPPGPPSTSGRWCRPRWAPWWWGGSSPSGRAAASGRGRRWAAFELAGSTIVLLFERGRIQLLPRLLPSLAGGREVRVFQGMWIATGPGGSDHG